MLIKTASEIEKIRVAGKILATVSEEVKKSVQEGIALTSLDDLARTLLKKYGSEPAFLGYQPYGANKPYPRSICTSINDIVVHGVPTDYKLKSGDILKLDFGAIYEGYYADMAFTIGIGKISPQAQKLIAVTKKSLEAGIEAAQPGNKIGDIGYAINKYVKSEGFKVVKGLTGHGIGKALHEEPSVYNEGQPGTGIKLKPGMVLALEPMVSAGSPIVKQLPDDSYATKDNSLSAHFEHTIAITENGPKILTIEML